MRPARRRTQVEVLLDKLAEAEALGQGGRQEEPRVGHQAVVVKTLCRAGRGCAMIASIRCSSVGLDGLDRNAIFPVQMGT